MEKVFKCHIMQPGSETASDQAALFCVRFLCTLEGINILKNRV